MQRTTGEYILSSTVGEPVNAFVPFALPPEPPIAMDSLFPLLDRANQALGRLDGFSMLLPAPRLFLYNYVRKEAVLSSQIEGTQSSLSDLLLFEMNVAPGVPLEDVQEVSSYMKAMNHGLKRLREGFPISLRLIREMHQALLSDGRGADKTPGEFRRSQNWIGGTRPGNAIYVPPPPDRLMECLDRLEKFLHDDSQTLPLLVQLALIHVQFETIHPFLDGNGRLGRLLITLLLCSRGALRAPHLYLSLYFKTHRSTYYDLLQKVRIEGAWEEWLEFFLVGVAETATEAANTANQLMQLFEEDRSRIKEIGRAGPTALLVHEYMQKRPAFTIGMVASDVHLSIPTVSKTLARLSDLGIVREITGQERNRVFVYESYMDSLSSGTEPIKP